MTLVLWIMVAFYFQIAVKKTAALYLMSMDRLLENEWWWAE